MKDMIEKNVNALKCPGCGAKISIWQKSSLCNRNSYRIRCKNCGERCKLPKWANLNYLIIALIFVVPIIIIEPSWTKIIVLAGLYVIITSIVTVFFIPLIRVEKD